MLYNLGQTRQYIAQKAAIQNSNGIYDFDSTTFPTIDLVNNMINDATREICSSWDYTFLESTRSYPFNHVISGVQGVYLSGISNVASGIGKGISVQGNVVPFPNEVLNYSWIANNQPTLINNNFSGVAFSGVGSDNNLYSATSYFGYPIQGNYSGIGYTYQLDQDVDKIIACMISNSNQGGTPRGLMLTAIDYRDMEKLIPIGVINASGTPNCYASFPGFGPQNNKSIQFFPTPVSGFMGESFIIHYKKKHVDLIQDTDIQSVIPEKYQDVIMQGSLEKIFDILDNPKLQVVSQRKQELEYSMRVDDGNQPDKVRSWQDANYLTTVSRAYDTSVHYYI